MCSADGFAFGLATAAEVPTVTASAKINPVLVRTFLIILLLGKIGLNVLRLKPSVPVYWQESSHAFILRVLRSGRCFTEDFRAPAADSAASVETDCGIFVERCILATRRRFGAIFKMS